MRIQANTCSCSLSLLWFIIIAVGLAGCGRAFNGLLPQKNNEFYLPPTAAEITTRIIMPSPTPILFDETPTADSRPSPTPQCTNNLRFIDDLTIPDGTQFSPGTTMDKRWQIENTGSCNWDERYRMKLIAGTDLGASSEQALFPARSSTQARLRILFFAPTEPGIYRSAWQAFSPQGTPFGDPFFIEIVVENP